VRFNYAKELALAGLGIAIVLLNVLFIYDYAPFLFPIINVAGGLIASVPVVMVVYTRYRIAMEIDQQFVVFMRDLTASINSGMTLPLALSHCSKNNYMALGPHVRDLSAQVDWGIPFNRALETFSKRISSVSVKRSVATIIETYKVGGKIADTLDAINRSLVTIESIRKERSSSVRSEVVTSYMIYLVFIFILVILQSFLIPTLTQRSTSAVALDVTQAPQTLPSTESYAETFSIFIIMQGFFAGLATGKMAEGSIAHGLKHSLILIVSGYLIFSLAAQVQLSF
jgi:flagellar protein FlaJ